MADQLKTHASTAVVYQRGADQVAVNATIGKTEFEVDDGTGIIKRVQSRDFLIQTADLQLAGTTTLPLASSMTQHIQNIDLSNEQIEYLSQQVKDKISGAIRYRVEYVKPSKEAR